MNKSQEEMKNILFDMKNTLQWNKRLDEVEDLISKLEIKVEKENLPRLSNNNRKVQKELR